jgi:hypothetical protein
MMRRGGHDKAKRGTWITARRKVKVHAGYNRPFLFASIRCALRMRVADCDGWHGAMDESADATRE